MWRATQKLDILEPIRLPATAGKRRVSSEGTAVLNFDDEKEWSGPSRVRLSKRGGRKKGSKNRRTVERAQALAAIKASGKDPISFFADLLRNESAPLELRFQAAKELAPYVHPKLTSVESRTGGETHEDRIERLRAMLDRTRGG